MKINTYPQPFTVDDYIATKDNIDESGVNPVAIATSVAGTAAVAGASGLYIKSVSDKKNMQTCHEKTNNENVTYYVYSTINDEGKEQDEGNCITCCAEGYLRIAMGTDYVCKNYLEPADRVSANPASCAQYNQQKEKVAK
jgi:hypothetical protein